MSAIVLTPTTPTDEVAAYITLHLQPSIDPVLTSEEFAAIVALAPIADSEGRAPDDTDWEATYDIPAAIAEGWAIKAAKVAGAYAFADAGLSLHREQVYDHCLKQAALWRGRSAGTGTVFSEAVLDALEDLEESEVIVE